MKCSAVIVRFFGGRSAFALMIASSLFAADWSYAASRIKTDAGDARVPGCLDLHNSVDDCSSLTSRLPDLKNSAGTSVFETYASNLIGGGAFYVSSGVCAAGSAQTPITCSSWCSSLGYGSGSVDTALKYCSTTSPAGDSSYCSCSGGSSIIDRVYISVMSPSTTVDTCTKIVVGLSDSKAMPVDAIVDHTIRLQRNTATGTFYSDSACTNSITTTTISAGTSKRFVYFVDTVAETVQLQGILLGLPPNPSKLVVEKALE